VNALWQKPSAQKKIWLYNSAASLLTNAILLFQMAGKASRESGVYGSNGLSLLTAVSSANRGHAWMVAAAGVWRKILDGVVL
jgi:hypothetical protein